MVKYVIRVYGNRIQSRILEKATFDNLLLNLEIPSAVFVDGDPWQVVVVSRPTRAWHAESFGVRSSDQACCIRCKNLALNIRDCVSVSFG